MLRRVDRLAVNDVAWLSWRWRQNYIPKSR